MSNEIQVSNLMPITITKLKEIALERILNEYNARQTLTHIPSFMLWGGPGIGKSDILELLASQIANAMSKKLIFHDIRLLLYNPVDLRGLPTFNEDKTRTIWVPNEEFIFDPSEDIINVILFDELPAAPLSVQTAAYQLILNRRIGTNKLPDNVIVLAAGNRVQDRAGAQKPLKPLVNRFTNFELMADLESWKVWAKDNDIDSRIIGYLNWKPEALYIFEPNSDDVAFPTPRSWAMAASHMRYASFDNAMYLVQGSIGVGTANEFEGFCKVYADLPNVDDIFKGKKVDVPTSPDVLYALSAKLVSKILDYMTIESNGHVKEVKEKELANLAKYINKFEIEYATVTVSDMLRAHGSVGSAFLKIKGFEKWFNLCRKFIV